MAEHMTQHNHRTLLWHIFERYHMNEDHSWAIKSAWRDRSAQRAITVGATFWLLLANRWRSYSFLKTTNRSWLDPWSPEKFCARCAIRTDVKWLSDERSLPDDEHPVFAQSGTGTAGGSNPTPGAFSSTHSVEWQSI